MAASTVNIADFHCRGLKRHSDQALSRAGHNPSRLKIVASQSEPESEVVTEVPAAEDSSVLEISGSHESERMRQRMVFRSIATHRHRSNEIRFNEPHVAVMRIDQPRGIEHWAHFSDDCDLPPAA